MSFSMYQVIKNRKIRMAIVGCGRIAKNHFGSVEKHEKDIDLIAICDVDVDVLEEHREKYQVAAYRSLKVMLDQEELDIVTLCTPSGMHSYQTELIAAYGVHVMTEKPMATRWSDGVAMVKACDKAGVRLFVVKQNRRNSTLRLLKRAMQECILDSPTGILRSSKMAWHLGIRWWCLYESGKPLCGLD